MPARDDKTGRYITQNLSDAQDLAKGLSETIKSQGPLLSALTGEYSLQKKLLGEIKDELDGNSKLSEKEVKALAKSAKLSQEKASAINEIAPGMMSMANSAVTSAKSFGAFLGPLGGAVAAAIALGKAFFKIQAAITDTRKELGVSAEQAASITVQNKVLGQIAKGYGLTVEDISQAQASIRQDLGASVQESINLSLNFARTAAATGQTSSQLAKTLSIMESVSSQSRDALLNQLRTNAALAGQAGVAPALVMQDLADNAQFFAKFAKDGGMNILNASIAARKLGLELGAVESISESLLNFESSIENQLQASLLLGRQINLDKARQLAITGDQEGGMREILKQVGGEAEFNRLNVIQRQALADSVGVNVEQLSRLVRNNTAAVPAGVGRDEELRTLESIDRKIGKVASAI